MHKYRSLRALLREATHDQHIRLHKHPLLATIMQPNHQLSDYHKLLLAYFGLYQFVEARIQQYLNNETVNFSYQERYKLPWLANDLAFFHITPIACNNLSLTVRHFPHITSLGQLVGILYVLEGSTLGASHMSLKLAEQHHLRPEQAVVSLTVMATIPSLIGNNLLLFLTPSRVISRNAKRP